MIIVPNADGNYILNPDSTMEPCTFLMRLASHVVTFWVAKLILGVEVEFWNFIIFVGTTLLLLSPLYYALSKIVWANLFLNYKGEANEKS